LAAGWQVLSNDARLALVFDLGNDDWLVRESRDLLQDLANRERKLSEGKAPDAEAEAERRAQIETIRAQTEATRAQAEAERADAEAERARAAELTSQDYKTRGRVLAAAIEARASGVARAEANEAAAPTKENED
jgi:hypothetical protein